jgi:hypothetical protein
LDEQNKLRRRRRKQVFVQEFLQAKLIRDLPDRARMSKQGRRMVERGGSRRGERVRGIGGRGSEDGVSKELAVIEERRMSRGRGRRRVEEIGGLEGAFEEMEGVPRERIDGGIERQDLVLIQLLLLMVILSGRREVGEARGGRVGRRAERGSERAREQLVSREAAT